MSSASKDRAPVVDGHRFIIESGDVESPDITDAVWQEGSSVQGRFCDTWDSLWTVDRAHDQDLPEPSSDSDFEKLLASF